MELATESRLISEAIAAASERARWKRIAALHERGTREAFDSAVALASSRSSDERRLGADILGQLGFRHASPFRAESEPILRRLVDIERDPEVLAAALVAIGYLG